MFDMVRCDAMDAMRCGAAGDRVSSLEVDAEAATAVVDDPPRPPSRSCRDSRVSAAADHPADYPAEAAAATTAAAAAA